MPKKRPALSKKRPALPAPEQSKPLSQKGVSKLLSDQILLDELRDLCETGASIGTMEAKLGLNTGQLSKWLTWGEQKPKSPYRQLLKLFRSWVATARHAAESHQLVKAPSQWLERNSASKKLDTDEQPVQATIQNLPAHQQLQLGAQAAIAAIEALVASGISIDESARKGQIRAALPPPTPLNTDISE